MVSSRPFARRPRPGPTHEWALVDYGLTTLITDAEGFCVAEFADRADAEFVLTAIRQATARPPRITR